MILPPEPVNFADAPQFLARRIISILAELIGYIFVLKSKFSFIPLESMEVKTLEKGQYHAYELWTILTSADSPFYKLAAQFFDNGSSEQLIKFQNKLEEFLEVQNVTSGTAKYSVAKTPPRG